MKTVRRLVFSAMVSTFALAGLMPGAQAVTEPQQVSVTGEVIDTWCYLSGVMGAGDAVTGSSHHTCALWCAAGGIPVGVLAEDGTIYMVIKWAGSDALAKGNTLMEVQSNQVAASGLLFRRDGINYLMVEEVVSNDGIVNLSHEDYDVVPDFSIPKPKK